MIAGNRLAAIAGLALAASLGACSGTGSETAADGTVTETNRTLATVIGKAPALTTVSGALSEAGLASVFDGPGSYTLLAPDNDAFDKLGAEGKSLTDEQRRAQLVAILRGHILPGQITPDAIRKAVADKKGPVTMTTLADGTVTFDTNGDTITISSSDGSRATVDGAALVASNGVVLPLDGFVHKIEPASEPS